MKQLCSLITYSSLTFCSLCISQNDFIWAETQKQILESTTKTRTELSANLNTKINKSIIQPLSRSCQMARATSVRLYGSDRNNWGSGVIFHEIEEKNGVAKYYVITNKHVVKDYKSLNVLTSDQFVHKGLVNQTIKFDQDDDLAIVDFISTNGSKYEIATMANYEVSEDESIFAAGFPSRPNKNANPEFECLAGKVALVMDQSRTFVGGYRVGYDPEIVGGMSGGGVFNGFGEVVALNGRPKKFRLFSPYIYKHNQQIPCEPIHSFAIRLSWGIPISTVINQVNKVFGNNLANDKLLSSNISRPIDQEENATLQFKWGSPIKKLVESRQIPISFGLSLETFASLANDKLLSSNISRPIDQEENATLQFKWGSPVKKLVESQQMPISFGLSFEASTDIALKRQIQVITYLISQPNQFTQSWIGYYQTEKNNQYKDKAKNIKNLQHCQISSVNHLQFVSR